MPITFHRMFQNAYIQDNPALLLIQLVESIDPDRRLYKVDNVMLALFSLKSTA